MNAGGNVGKSSMNTTRLVIGIVLVIITIRIATNVGGWMFGDNLSGSVTIYCIALATYIVLQVLSNRKSAREQQTRGLSGTGIIASIILTIVLCGLARYLPFLRN